MCGIAGLAGHFAAAHGRAVAARMSDTLVHRGPDDAGLWATDGFAFAMRRLAIIDLAGGQQPMWTDDGIGIVFNGEIYNYRALRAELEAEGCAFRTRSDTEILLQGYRREGLAFVARLEGMFAFCLYDPARRELHLVRDRFGVKPLYYALIGGVFYFASEIKAILAALPQRPELSRQALHDYLTLRFVPTPDTIWDGIRKLPPAHTLSLSLTGGEPRLGRYWRLDFHAEPLDRGRDYVAEFGALFLAAVEKRLLAADVPVGVLLSGGLDSSAVLAAAAELGHRELHTFCVGFADGGDYDESAFARAAASQAGARHHEVMITRQQFLDFLPRFAGLSDEPLADLASVPLYYVSELARSEVKAVLSGEGSDELLAGYDFDRMARRYDRLQAVEGWVRGPLRRLLAACPLGGAAGEWLRLWGRHGWQGMAAARPSHMTRHWSHAAKSALWRDSSGLSGTEERIRSWYEPLAGRHPLDQIQQVYCGDWLTEDLLMKADKMSMAASLELREPFLDHRLAEWTARLPLSWRVGSAASGYCSKRVLRAFCSGRIPQSVIERPKRGFPVPAYGWLAQGLGGWAQALVLGPTARLRDRFDMAAARPVLDRAMRGDREAAHRIWVLIVLEHWLQAWT